VLCILHWRWPDLNTIIEGDLILTRSLKILLLLALFSYWKCLPSTNCFYYRYDYGLMSDLHPAIHRCCVP
jgi:hypothetical protein